MTQPLLTDDYACFIQGAVSILAASRDSRCVPSVSRAIALRVSADRREVTLLLATSQCRQLLADIASTRAVAMVCTEPSTHRTVQIKGFDARLTPLQDGDYALATAHNEAFAEHLMPLGYARELALTVHDVSGDTLTAVTFAVDAMFEQTPGPRAGTRMGA